ncbi:MAG: hypothetical protein JWQ97_3395 [Phenylobacterium sp.]|nr:hypothetical protein [Phenylobacterium sp.]
MTDRAEVFREWFAVTPSASRILDALYEASGRVVAHQVLRAVSQQTRNGVELSIKFLRAAMDPGAIANEMGEGYRLTLAGLKDCDRALEDAVQRERAA